MKERKITKFMVKGKGRRYNEVEENAELEIHRRQTVTQEQMSGKRNAEGK